MTGSKELEILRQNLLRIVAEFKTPVSAISTVAQIMSEGRKVEISQVAEVLRQQVEKAEEILRRLERLAG